MTERSVLKMCAGEITSAGDTYGYKRYATNGLDVPLKKDWSESWCLLTADFDKIFDEILNFEVHKDDVFVVTYMKSGTTWMQECAWLLMNNLDFVKSRQAGVLTRSPFLEFKCVAPSALSPAEIAQQLARPRLLKTHLPPNLLPPSAWQKKCKMIYVARNIRDVIVSSYHFTRNINQWRGNDIVDYVDDFINNKVLYSYYWEHVMDYWRLRNEPFMFFVTYEEMQRDLAAVLQRLCTFLDRQQLSQEELAKCLEYLSFESMKNNKSTNLTFLLREKFPVVKESFEFMRRGIVGSFEDELTPQLIAKIDNWTAKSLSPYNVTEEAIFGKWKTA